MMDGREMKAVVTWLCLAGFLVVASNGDVVRSKRDDVDPITVVTIQEMPYVKKDKDGKFIGFIPDMMAELNKRLRLSYEFKEVADNKYGQEVSNGNWNGMIGEIQKGSADMAAAPMTMSDDRKTVVDFTDPYMTFDITALIQKDGNKANINSIHDLAEQTEVQYGVVKDGHTEAIFRDAEDGTEFRKMWQEIKKNDNRFRSIEEGVKKVRESNGTFAFIMERVSADYWVLKKPCTLTTTQNGKVKEGSYAFAMKKNFKHEDDFNEEIKAMREDGTIDELKRKWWKGECGESGSVIQKALSFPVLGLACALCMYRL